MQDSGVSNETTLRVLTSLKNHRHIFTSLLICYSSLGLAELRVCHCWMNWFCELVILVQWSSASPRANIRPPNATKLAVSVRKKIRVGKEIGFKQIEFQPDLGLLHFRMQITRLRVQFFHHRFSQVRVLIRELRRKWKLLGEPFQSYSADSTNLRKLVIYTDNYENTILHPHQPSHPYRLL